MHTLRLQNLSAEDKKMSVKALKKIERALDQIYALWAPDKLASKAGVNFEQIRRNLIEAINCAPTLYKENEAIYHLLRRAARVLAERGINLMRA